ncbi:hypothetical protein [Sphingomonas sp. TF3]|uniref:hypothetical protein n=1 Tax=Sphingomonas sp. TF3 TaxID=2495580 RepID=UPI00163C66B5|nr:hypothetical protein [Sphingomonas sp. TF3]
MPQWKSRLAVRFNDGSGPALITPIESFQPSFAMNAEALSSIEAINIGVIYMPEQISFTITAKAIGTSAAHLTKLALDGKRFQIILSETDGGDPEWALAEVLLDQCVITNATPSSAAISGAPTATFSGFALGGRIKATGLADGVAGAPVSAS